MINVQQTNNLKNVLNDMKLVVMLVTYDTITISLMGEEEVA